MHVFAVGAQSTAGLMILLRVNTAKRGMDLAHPLGKVCVCSEICNDIVGDLMFIP